MQQLPERYRHHRKGLNQMSTLRTRLCSSAIALAGAVAIAVTAMPAAAQDNPGIYIFGKAGANWLANVDLPAFSGTTRVETEHDVGLTGMGGLGYDFANGLALELELGYRGNDIDSIGGPQTLGTDGDISTWSVMANVVGTANRDGMVQPYLGFGVGYAQAEVEDLRTINGLEYNDDEGVIAFQGFAGLATDVTERLRLHGEYRYFQSGNIPLRAPSTTFDYENRNHSLLVGLSYSLAEPPPPPPPAPEPEPVAEPAPAPEPEPTPPPVSRNYIVFFNFDESTLTTEARSILDAAAQNFRMAGSTRITLTGHTDTSGSNAYNQALSERRAAAVEAYLETRGVPSDALATRAEGETMPLVPTGDGVREPQNRRVEIVFN